MDDARATAEHVTAIHVWTPKLFSFRLTRPDRFRFRAGQFARLGVDTPQGRVWRAYSMASSSLAPYLEFFSILVPDGAFSTHLAQAQVGDTLWLDRQAFGFLTLERFQGGRDLWLLATGTGLAPFLSILGEPDVWQQYQNVVLVYSVRTAAELAYQAEIAQLAAHPLFAEAVRERLQVIPVVTRETLPGALSQRIPQLLQDGSLERHVGLPLDPARARLMICGNPQMVADTRQVLQARGLTLSRQAAPGHFALEQYW